MFILFGEVPKLAEGTPLERVQVVNSGARVQIPPSPLLDALDAMLTARKNLKKSKKLLTKSKRCDSIIKLTASRKRSAKHFEKSD